MEKDTGNKIELGLVTTSRRDLFNISAILARGLDESILNDKDNRLLIAVNGTINGGKSIFPHVIRQVLLSSVSPIVFHGSRAIDEYWYGMQRNKSILEVVFANVRGACSLDRYTSSRKQYGGVTMLHNTSRTHGLSPDIDIWVEAPLHDKNDSDFKPPMRSPEAQSDFNKAAKLAGDWARYVKITVNDDRLCTSETFRSAAERLRQGEYTKGDAFGRKLKLKGLIYDFIQDIPFVGNKLNIARCRKMGIP